jgi:hypothetical protein
MNPARLFIILFITLNSVAETPTKKLAAANAPKKKKKLSKLFVNMPLV